MPDIDRLEVPEGAEGTRLDKWLAGQPSIGSRSKARHVLESGKVRIDGQPVGAAQGGQPVVVGSVIEIVWSKPGSSRQRTRGRRNLDRLGVSVLHEDDRLVVVDKPSGLLTDAADADQRKHRDTLTKRVGAYRGARVWPVHRIDRDTTGVVAFACDEAAFRACRAQWERPETLPERRYLAVVTGSVAGEGGHWADWMAWDAKLRVQRAANEGAGGALLAEADWEVVERMARATLIEVSLVTGRRNQIRLHALLRGTPLVGDRLYRLESRRDRSGDRRRRDGIPFDRQALHARLLGLAHPATGERMTFEAPLPADLSALLARLGASR